MERQRFPYEFILEGTDWHKLSRLSRFYKWTITDITAFNSYAVIVAMSMNQVGTVIWMMNAYLELRESNFISGLRSAISMRHQYIARLVIGVFRHRLTTRDFREIGLYE